MALIHGRNIIVSKLVGNAYTAIAAAKSCDIEVEVEQIEVASTSSGQWREYIQGRKGWRVTVSGLVTAVKDALIQDDAVSLKIGVRDSSTDYISGNAIVRTSKVTGTVGNISQYSVVFIGNGALT